MGQGFTKKLVHAPDMRTIEESALDLYKAISGKRKRYLGNSPLIYRVIFFNNMDKIARESVAEIQKNVIA